MCLQLGVSCCGLKIAFGKKYDATSGLWHVGIANVDRGSDDVNVSEASTLTPETTVVLDSPLSGTPGGQGLVVHGLRTDASGNIYVMFTDEFASDTALYLAKLTSEGTLVWRTQISEISSAFVGDFVWGMLAMRDDDSSVYGSVYYQNANSVSGVPAGTFEPVGGGEKFWGFRARTSDGYAEQYFSDSIAGVTMHGTPDFCRWGAGKIWIGPDGTGFDDGGVPDAGAANASTGRRVYALDDAGSATVHDAGGTAQATGIYYRRIRDVAFNSAGDRWYAVQANDGADSADTTLLNLVEAFAVSGDAPAWKFTVEDTNDVSGTHRGFFDTAFAKLVRDPVTDQLVGCVNALQWSPPGVFRGRFNLRDDGSSFTLLLNTTGGLDWIDLQPRRDKGGSRGFVASVAQVAFAQYRQGADFVS